MRNALFLLIFLAAISGAQQVSLAPVVSGFVFDADVQAIRPLIGVPGAAYLGESVVDGLEAASVSPAGNLAVAFKGGRLHLVTGLGGAKLEISEIPSVLSQADIIAWSRDGAATLLLSSATRDLEVWRFASGDPKLSFAAELGEIVGNLQAAAVESSGERAVVAAGDSVYLVGSDGSSRLLMRRGDAVALLLTGQDQELLVADGRNHEILRLKNFWEGGGPELFAGPAQGVSNPSALAVTEDGCVLLVASRADKSILALLRENGQVLGRLEVEFQPTRLERLAKSIFALNRAGEGGHPLEVLDATRELAAYFVPAGPGAVQRED